jgi:calcium-translocating P-type ATPase
MIESTKLLVGTGTGTENGEQSPLQSPPPGGGLKDYGGAQQLDCSMSNGGDTAAAVTSLPECSVLELRQLMTLRGSEAVERIQKDYGGVEQLCRKLRTDPDYGLRTDEAGAQDMLRRRQLFGCNQIPGKASKLFVYFLWEAVQDMTLVILILAAVASLCLSFYSPPDDIDTSGDPTESQAGYIESLGILIAVFIIVIVTAFINWSKDVQFRGLQKQLEKQFRCLVIRNGDVRQLPVSDVVVGDICVIKYGDVIPADGIVVRSSELRLDESSHTGESKDVRKSPETDPTLYAGTDVVEGCGKMVVTAVGVHSAKGIIFSLLGVTYNDEDEPEEKRSVLHQKLVRIALQITYAGTLLALLTFVILVLRFCIETFVEYGLPWSAAYVQDFLSYLVISITLLAVAVPEGLPLAVVLALAYSIRKMMNDNNLVRHLDACETMGNATTICCDKTGTLTTNRMEVVQSHIAGRLCTTSGDLSTLPTSTVRMIAAAISINSSYTTRLQAVTNGNGNGHVGNRTELALLSFVVSLGQSYDEYRRTFPETCFRKLYTFSSQRKWMGTVVPSVDRRSAVTAHRLYVKGASEIILNRCQYLVSSGGLIRALTAADRQELQTDVVETMAGQGLRTICIAFRDFVHAPAGDDELAEHELGYTVEPDWNDETEIIQRLVCLAIVGIEDPVRPEVPAAIQRCQKAGITVRMVTGDNINTARFIAVKCGILRPGEDLLVLDGAEFNRRIRRKPGGPVEQELMDTVWPRLRVLARSSPEDKYNLVKGIMDSRLNTDREIVAVTGDGTNDAPALKKAHVGLAMGISGTDVAKEASDIILLDDNYASIVKAVVWGRHVYDSIAKFLQFQLTVNVVAVTLALLGACVVLDSPLKGIQMLWVNLLMDTLASLSLSTERPTEELLNRKPYGYSQPLVSPTMLSHILCHAVYELAVLIGLLFAGEKLIGVDSGRDHAYRGLPTVHYTFLFNTFVMMILCNELCARKLDGTPNFFAGLHRSPLFIVIWLASFVTQVLIVQLGGNIFFTIGLTIDQWLWCVVFGIGDLIYGQVISGIAAVIVHLRTGCQINRSSAEHDQKKGENDEPETVLYEMQTFPDNKPFYHP